VAKARKKKIESIDVLMPELHKQQRMAVSAEELYILFGGAVGGGKLQSLDSIVYTPYGTRKMGDIKVGDNILNPNGSPQKVIAVHPQGVKDLYRITFADGASTKVGLEHLWLIKKTMPHKTKRKDWNYLVDTDFCQGESRIWTTQQIIEFLRNKEKADKKAYIKGVNLLIPLCKPLRFTKSYSVNPRTVEPYLLGILIGDGSLTNKSNFISYTSLDIEISKRLKEYGYKVKCGKNKKSWYIEDKNKILKNKLEKLGIFGCIANNKFIPKYYKWGTIEERIELIQGLMDSDGYVDDRGHMSYMTVSKKLAKDFQFVIHSLGGKATITDKIPTYVYKDVKFNGQKAYTIYFNTKINDQLVFLSRKRERMNNGFNGGVSELSRRIIDVEYVGKEEAQCITVDNPNGLYITDDFIVTHNSIWLCWYAVLLSLIFPGNRGYLCRHENTTFKKTTLLTLLEEVLIRRLWDKTVKQHNKSEQVIKFINGSAIYYGGLKPTQTDKPVDRIKSMTLGWFGIDEASETTKEYFELLLTRLRILLPNGTRPIYKGLCTSNPEIGWVHDTFVENPDPDYRFIPSRIKDNPYLPKDYEQRLRKGLPPELVKKYVEGLWVFSQAGNFVFPYHLVKQAAERETEPDNSDIDPARYGGDKIVVAVRKGNKVRIRFKDTKLDTMETVEETGKIVEEEISEYNEAREKKEDEKKEDSFENETGVITLVDTVGVGSGVYDRLKQLKIDVREFIAGEKKLEEGKVDIPNDPELISQMSGIKYKISREKKIQIESKQDMKSRGQRSPDETDAIVMAFADPGFGDDVDIYLI